ncbi:MAG TPA: YhcH/YjgK/YiaL family protein [Mucilaginibacter sp.]|jgi:YhcH/YjgK/YiaL family protein
MSNTTGAVIKNIWNEKSAAKWFANKDWKNGLSLKPHLSVNKSTFAGQYHKYQTGWDKAFKFLKDNNLETIEPGKYEIDGDNVYAIITEAPSKEFEQSKWEAHEKFIDIQYVIKGEEKIGVTPLSAATVSKPYDDTNDYANYEADGKYYTAKPGTFFLFFPDDVHRPNVKVKGHGIVKKAVIKIRIAE